MRFKALKSFPNMPCAHQQWFDTDESGLPMTGGCARYHGYDRSVDLEIEGQIDSHGWVFPFGKFKQVRQFLEYYFDHTALAQANDPRYNELISFNDRNGFFNLRTLPYGVSMEMSALFIWEHVNRYIYHVTDGRCALTKVTCREHEKNASCLEFDLWEAQNHGKSTCLGGAEEFWVLPMKPFWPFVEPHEAYSKNGQYTAALPLNLKNAG